MKNILKLKSGALYLLVMLSLFLGACSNSPKNLNVMPKETAIVFSVDAYSLSKKAKLKEVAEFSFVQKIKEELRLENKKLADVLEAFIKDPATSGVDFKNDFFIYILMGEERESYSCFTMNLRDESDFSTFFIDVLTKAGMPVEVLKDEKSGAKYVQLDDEVVMGWDDDKALLVGSNSRSDREKVLPKFGELMTLKSNDRITENGHFMAFDKGKKDLGFWMSTNFMDNMDGGMQPSKMMGVDFSNSYMAFNINFEEDEMVVTSNFEGNEELNKTMKSFTLHDDQRNEGLLNYLPESTYGCANFSINPKGYYDLINESGMLKMFLGKGFEKNLGMTLEDAAASIKGNMVMSLIGFEKAEYIYQGYGYTFNKSMATPIKPGISIDEIGYLSPEMQEQLNNGETVRVYVDYDYYGINIKNILAKGGTLETAMADGATVNAFEGGWEYGVLEEELRYRPRPLIGFTFDLNNNTLINTLIEKMPDSAYEKTDGYYHFFIDGNKKESVYLAYNETNALITNHKESVEVFSKGGFADKNLSTAAIVQEISPESIFMYMNLDYNQYPEVIKEMMESEMGKEETKLMEIWTAFGKDVIFKRLDDHTSEMRFRTKEFNENILFTVFKLIEDNYGQFLAM